MTPSSRSTAGAVRRRPTCPGSPPTSACRTARRRRRWNCAPAGATRRAPCIWPTRSRWRRGAGRWPCASCCPAPDAQPGTVTCALLTDVGVERDWVADHLAGVYHGAVDGGRGRSRRRRCWCGATPMPRRSPTRSPPAGCRSRWSDCRACCRCPRWPTSSRCCG